MAIKSVWLNLNNSCNLRCEWCYAQKNLHSNMNMDIEKSKSLIAKLKDKGIHKVTLIGGEPTVYEQLDELIRYIKSNNLYCSMATNGLRFQDINYSKRIVEKGIDNINISLKGLSDTEYEQNTRVSALTGVLEGYKNLKSIGFNPTFSYVFVDDDKNKMDMLVNFLKTNAIEKIGFQFVKPVLKLSKEDTTMDMKKMGIFVEYIYNKMKECNTFYSLEISFPVCLIDNTVLKKLIAEKRIVTCCHIQKGTGLVLTPDFKVLPCNHFAEFPFSSSMDFSSENFIEEFNATDEVKEFRKKVNTYPSLKCKECKYWSICGGGCVTRWLFNNPSDYIK